MKLKTMSMLTGVLVLMTLVGVFIDRQGDGPESNGRLGASLLEGVDLSEARGIEIVNDEGQVRLHAAGGEWRVREQGDFPAGPDKIQSFLLRLSRAEPEHKVTENVEKLGQFGLLRAEENGGKLEKGRTATVFTVKDDQGGVLYELLIGGDRQRRGAGVPPTTGGGQYVRFGAEPAAYLIAQPLFLERKAKDWLRSKLFAFDHQALFAEVVISQPGQETLRLSREKAKEPWQVKGVSAEKHNTRELEQLLQRIGDLELSQVVKSEQDAAVLGMAKTAQIDLRLFDKRSYRIRLGLKNADEEYRYAALSAALPKAVSDKKLRAEVDTFNVEFGKVRIAVFEWEAEQILKTRKDLVKR